jgi:glycerol-3-phosphate cytidylyltransferase
MKDEIVGYTTGVFDLFHVGHLRLLNRAKSKCDRLIVGVSTDELVEEYKSKKPVIPYEERAEIVSALKCVDEVVPQKHRDKIAAYHEIKFDLMFVGSDWKGSDLFNEVESELALQSTLQAIYDEESLVK